MHNDAMYQGTSALTPQSSCTVIYMYTLQPEQPTCMGRTVLYNKGTRLYTVEAVADRAGGGGGGQGGLPPPLTHVSAFYGWDQSCMTPP